MPPADDVRCRPVAVPWRTRLLAAPALLLVLALAPAGARAEDQADELLAQARRVQWTLGNHREAIALYDDVLNRPDLEPRDRAAALWGKAECHVALEEWPEAATAWTSIRSDARLPEDIRKRAAEALAKRAEVERTEAAAREAQRSGAEQIAEQERRKQANLDRLLDLASAAYQARRFDDAGQYVAQALEIDPESARAKELMERVLQEKPDRGEMVRSLLSYLELVSSESFQRVKLRLGELEEKGRSHQRARRFAEADLAFREAIALLDRSDFRAELEAERSNLVFWLDQVDTEGSKDTEGGKKGLTFPPVPVAPAGKAETGLKSRFYALLSETFSGRDGASDPIRFHEFVPAPVRDGQPRRSLGPNLFASRAIAVEQTASSLTRARWAERWIRANVGGDWAVREVVRESAPGRRPAPGTYPRLLERLEDTLFVQHSEGVQREIEALRASFTSRPTPVQVEVLVYGAGAGGTVRIATALRLPAAPPRDMGLESVLAGTLIEECRRDLERLENVTLLGHAQVRLHGDVAARLMVTERTETHPLHAGVAPPPLVILGLDPARYGLFLDLYAEDLPNLQKPQPRAAALSVVGRVRMPLPSVVVTGPDPAPDKKWRRLPKFAECTVESDRRLPHTGTLVLTGLPNPFVDTAATFPDLVLLVAVRPLSTDGRPAPTPDPEPWRPTVPEARQIALGALATEVADDMVPDGWPEDRSASQPMAEAVARRARDEYLATLLAQRARVPMPGGTNPVTVHDGLLSATVGTKEQVLLGEAAEFLASQETALYEVDALAVESDRAFADAWVQREGVTVLGTGSWLVPASLANALDGELEARRVAGPSPYALRVRQIVRATQQVALRQLTVYGITRQMRVARSAKTGEQRLVPVPGVAEEGLVIQVRPGLEEGGQRVVTVRGRAARIRTFERVPLKGVEARDVAMEVPLWHPHQDRASAATLKDGDVLLLRLAVPEDPTRALLVAVSTRKLQ
jgi:tetratricopeptide (TPR) repeat protein